MRRELHRLRSPHARLDDDGSQVGGLVPDKPDLLHGQAILSGHTHLWVVPKCPELRNLAELPLPFDSIEGDCPSLHSDGDLAALGDFLGCKVFAGPFQILLAFLHILAEVLLGMVANSDLADIHEAQGLGEQSRVHIAQGHLLVAIGCRDECRELAMRLGCIDTTEGACAQVHGSCWPRGRGPLHPTNLESTPFAHLCACYAGILLLLVAQQTATGHSPSASSPRGSARTRLSPWAGTSRAPTTTHGRSPNLRKQPAKFFWLHDGCRSDHMVCKLCGPSCSFRCQAKRSNVKRCKAR